MKKIIFVTTGLLLAIVFIACQSQSPNTLTDNYDEEADNLRSNLDTGKIEKIVKTDAEWKAQLTTDQYHVLREKGTERAFTGAYWDSKKKGVYCCSACKLPLFDAKTKFDSGTGWPSYYEPIKKEYVTEYKDNAFGMTRTEVTCGRCDGHLGHVFDDGPEPTGLRYCINSVSLILEHSGK